MDDELSSDEEEKLIKNELSDIPLGELQEIRHKIGTKRFDSALKEHEEKARDFRRANKNRPREVSSKRPVSRFREIVPIQKKKEKNADPRFDERAGKFNDDLFKKSFSFVNEMKKQEKEAIVKRVKKIKNPEEKQKLKRVLQQMESREITEAKDLERRALLKEHKKVQRELVKRGKKPFHIKKSTQRKVELAQKYMQLKKSEKLEKFMSKKRKKNASRDRKKLPKNHS